MHSNFWLEISSPTMLFIWYKKLMSPKTDNEILKKTGESGTFIVVLWWFLSIQIISYQKMLILISEICG